MDKKEGQQAPGGGQDLVVILCRNVTNGYCQRPNVFVAGEVGLEGFIRAKDEGDDEVSLGEQFLHQYFSIVLASRGKNHKPVFSTIRPLYEGC